MIEKSRQNSLQSNTTFNKLAQGLPDATLTLNKISKMIEFLPTAKAESFYNVSYYIKKFVKKFQCSHQTLLFLLSSRQTMNQNAKMNYFCNIITSVSF